MNTKSLPYFFLFLLLLFTGYLFQTGLSYSFILDDINNLKGLASLAQNNSFEQFLHFIFFDSHTASGRPVTLFSFALQASQWPNPIAFKQFNIILHLFNGILVYWFCQRLLKQTYSKEIPLLSLGITTLWLLSPIQVDTVHYIIQRMAMLATTFTLLGLITYSYARIQLDNTKKALFLLYPIFGLCLILAVFSKENGLLLTVFIILLEITLYRDKAWPTYYKLWFSLAIILPLILFVIYLLNHSNSSFLYTYKGFNALERLLTEQGIIIHYISSILMPSTSKLTLFFDDYTISRSLLSPPSTLFYLLLNSLFILAAFFIRKRWPLIAFGILFFYGNHLMESTFLRLELYFEHRNYLAVMGIALTLFCFIYVISRKQKKTICILLYSLPLFLLIISIWVNFQQNKLWSSPIYQAYSWYQSHPTSHRAHGYLGRQLSRAGLHKEVLEFYKTTSDIFPDDPSKILLWLELTCDSDTKSVPAPEELLKRMHNGKYYNETIVIINGFIKSFEKQGCPGINKAYFLDIILALLENPRYASNQAQQDLLIAKARLYQIKDIYSLAAEALEQALKIGSRLDIVVSLAEKYIYLGKLQKSYELIKQIEATYSEHPIKYIKYKEKLIILKQLYNARKSYQDNLPQDKEIK